MLPTFERVVIYAAAKLDTYEDAVERKPAERKQRHNDDQHLEHAQLRRLDVPSVPPVHGVGGRLALAGGVKHWKFASPNFYKEQNVEEDDDRQRQQILQAQIDAQEVCVGEVVARPDFHAQLMEEAMITTGKQINA